MKLVLISNATATESVRSVGTSVASMKHCELYKRLACLNDQG